MKIVGFKSFLSGRTSIDGKVYKEGIVYRTKGPIKFTKSGFHMCTRLTDTLMYASNPEELVIAQVEGWGKFDTYDDDYRGCYDMYAFEYLKILNFMSREEVISLALSLPDYEMCRFLSRFVLTEEEIKLFEGKNFSSDLVIDYYQKGIKEAFENDYKIKKIRKRYG